MFAHIILGQDGPLMQSQFSMITTMLYAESGSMLQKMLLKFNFLNLSHALSFENVNYQITS